MIVGGIIQAISASLAFIAVLVLLFVLRFRYKLGIEIYFVSLAAGGVIWIVGNGIGYAAKRIEFQYSYEAYAFTEAPVSAKQARAFQLLVGSLGVEGCATSGYTVNAAKLREVKLLPTVAELNDSNGAHLILSMLQELPPSCEKIAAILNRAVAGSVTRNLLD